MKKKIKNLTLKQAKALCDKYTKQNGNGLCNIRRDSNGYNL